MKRREFIAGLGGAATAWPLMVRAQQKPLPIIGLIFTGSPPAAEPLLVEFRGGLAEVGFY